MDSKQINDVTYDINNPYATGEIKVSNKSNIEKMFENLSTKFEVKKDYDLKLYEKAAILIIFIAVPAFFNLLGFILNTAISSFNLNFYAAIYTYIFRIGIFLVVLAYLGIFRWKVLIHQKLFGFFYFYLVVSFISLLTRQIAVAITPNLPNAYLNELTRAVHLVFYISLALFYIVNNKQLFGMVKKFFSLKESAWVYLLTIVSVGVFFFYGLNFIFGLVQRQIDSSLSSNQSSINNATNTALGIAYIFFLSVILAPIVEEYIYREVIIKLGDYKLHGYLLSTFMFGFAHIELGFDWSHLLVYLPLGFVNGLIYWKIKNIVPCILIHFIANFLAFFVNLAS